MADATEQDKLFFAELEKMPRHFSALSYPEGKIAIDDEWRITTAGREKRVCRGAEALRKFLNKYCRLSLSVAESTVSGEKKRIYLSWKEEAGEGFSITVKPDSVEIMGDSPAGALYGAHRFILERFHSHSKCYIALISLFDNCKNIPADCYRAILIKLFDR
jgi:hypothetical protein